MISLPQRGPLGQLLERQRDLDTQLVSYCQTRDRACLIAALTSARDVAARIELELRASTLPLPKRSGLGMTGKPSNG